jgi:hypothetical protein
MKTIVITRKYWGRNCLRSKSGMRCCLGFAAEAYGVSPANTACVGMPSSLPAQKSFLPEWLKLSANEDGTTADVQLASAINDSQDMIDAEKEKQLKEIFLKHKIRLVFRGTR